MLSFVSIIAAVAIGDWLLRRRKELGRAQLVGWSIGALTLLAAAAAAAPGGLLLQKCVAKLLMPVGWFWLAAAAATLWSWHRERTRWVLLSCALWLLITVTGSPIVGGRLVAALEAVHERRPFEAGQFDAVIVLGGGTSSTPWGEAQLGGSGDRVVLGARLYHRGQTPILVTSGSPIAGLQDGHDSVAATAQIWRELGVPEQAILEVSGARNTREESIVHTSLIDERGWNRVGVVSSAAHLPRAMGLFERQGAEVVALPADLRAPVASGLPDLYDVLPDADGLAMLQRALWEHLGRAVGR